MSDEQAISHLVVDESQRVSDWNLCVGLYEVTGITPFREADGSLWFNVYKGDVISCRVNGRFVVQVGYKDDPQ